MIEEANYTHESGLKFEVARLRDCTETDSYDISVILLWAPGEDIDPIEITDYYRGEPMKIIDYYCGEPTEDETKHFVDNWCNNQSSQLIKTLLERQNMQ